MSLLTKEQYLAMFSPPMLDMTLQAQALVELWDYADPIIEELYHSCTLWEWEVKHIYHSPDEIYQHIMIPVPINHTYLIVIVHIPSRSIRGHYILDLQPK